MKKCKHCKKEISEARPSHFSNQLAKKLGYCSFVCLSSDVGTHKALEILQKEEMQEILQKEGKY